MAVSENQKQNIKMVLYLQSTPNISWLYHFYKIVCVRQSREVRINCAKWERTPEAQGKDRAN